MFEVYSSHVVGGKDALKPIVIFHKLESVTLCVQTVPYENKGSINQTQHTQRR